MKKSIKVHAIEQLIEMSESVIVGYITTTGPCHTLFRDNLPPVTILGKQAYAFEQLANDLARQPDWSDKVSAGYVEDKLFELIVAIKEFGPSVAEARMIDLDDSIGNYSEETVIWVPVDGLILELEKLEAGRVVLWPTNPVEDAEQRITLMEMRQNDSGESGSLIPVEQPLEGTMTGVNSGAYAEYRVIAEPERAMERALEETRRAVEVLTLAGPAAFPNSDGGYSVVSVRGDVSRYGPIITVVGSDDKYLTQNRPQSSAPLWLSSKSLPKLESRGILDLFEVLAKSPTTLTDLEQALLRSIHWFASAQAQIELENRLLNLITAVESLLSNRGQVPSTIAVAEGTAVVLHDGFEERRETKAFMSKMYGARSGVSHGGAKVVFETEVRHLRNVACELILRISSLRRQVKSRQGLMEYIERRRLGGVMT